MTTPKPPDMDLTLDLFEIIGRLRRSADVASRYGQTDELHRIADQVLQWQTRLRKAVVLAIGHDDMMTGWGTIVNQIAELRRERDGAQMVRKLVLEEMTAIVEASEK